MMNITSISQINTATVEGKLLMAALVKLTTESQRDKEPDEVKRQCNDLANQMYPAKGNLLIYHTPSPWYKIKHSDQP